MRYDKEAETKFFRLKDKAEETIQDMKGLLDEQKMETYGGPHDIGDIRDMLDELERDIMKRFEGREKAEKERKKWPSHPSGSDSGKELNPSGAAAMRQTVHGGV